MEIRTDLAIENRELYKEKRKEEVPGVKVELEEGDDYTVTRVNILDPMGG